MSRRLLPLAGLAAISAVSAVLLFAWPGFLIGESPFLTFRPELQSRQVVRGELGSPDRVDRNCWVYLDRGDVTELRICFGPRGRAFGAGWSSKEPLHLFE